MGYAPMPMVNPVPKERGDRIGRDLLLHFGRCWHEATAWPVAIAVAIGLKAHMARVAGIGRN